MYSLTVKLFDDASDTWYAEIKTIDGQEVWKDLFAYEIDARDIGNMVLEDLEEHANTHDYTVDVSQDPSEDAWVFVHDRHGDLVFCDCVGGEKEARKYGWNVVESLQWYDYLSM